MIGCSLVLAVLLTASGPRSDVRSAEAGAADPEDDPAAHEETPWPTTGPEVGYPVDPAVRELTVVVSWKGDEAPGVELVAPGGTLLGRSDAAARDDLSRDETEIYSGPDLEPSSAVFLSVREPAPGRWRVLVDGTSPADDDAVAISYLARVDVDLSIEQHLVYTEELGLRWTWEVGLQGEPLELADVRARAFLAPSGPGNHEAQSLELRDDGLGFDRIAGDHRFTSRPWDGDLAGREIVAEMVGRMSGHPFIRQATGTAEDLPPIGLLELPPLVPGDAYQVVVIAESQALPIPLGAVKVSSMERGRVSFEALDGPSLLRDPRAPSRPLTLTEILQYGALASGDATAHVVLVPSEPEG